MTEEEILNFEKTLPSGYKVCRACLSIIKINKIFFGSLHVCK